MYFISQFIRSGGVVRHDQKKSKQRKYRFGIFKLLNHTLSMDAEHPKEDYRIEPIGSVLAIYLQRFE